MQTRLITILASLTLAACGNAPASDDSGINMDAAPIDAAGDSGTNTDAAPIDAAGDSGTPDASGADGGVVPSIVARFDGSMYQFPESVTLHGGDAFVSFINGHVMRVTASGTNTDFGSVPITYTAMNPDAYALGVASDPAGNIYVALVKSSASSPYPAGIYRIPAAGGTGTLLASDPMM